MKIILQILNLGTEGLPEKQAIYVQILNLLSVIVIFVSILYLGFYLFLGQMVPGLINVAAILLYSLTFFWTYKKWFHLARLWIFSIYMAHLLLLTLIVFSKDTGFHFYYLMIPALIFLLFENRAIKQAIGLSIVSILLFFTCEMVEIGNPYIDLPQAANRILYLSSILIAILGSLFILFMVTFNIRKYEEEQSRLFQDLQTALSEVKTLKGLLPICASCKKIRDDKGYWTLLESYIEEYSEASFSHGVCPECSETLYGNQDWYLKLKKNNKNI